MDPCEQARDWTSGCLPERARRFSPRLWGRSRVQTDSRRFQVTPECSHRELRGSDSPLCTSSSEKSAALLCGLHEPGWLWGVCLSFASLVDTVQWSLPSQTTRVCSYHIIPISYHIISYHILYPYHIPVSYIIPMSYHIHVLYHTHILYNTHILYHRIIPISYHTHISYNHIHIYHSHIIYHAHILS